jgi:hypothetical protein
MLNRWAHLCWIILLLPMIGCRGCGGNSQDSGTGAKDSDVKKKKQRLAADELRTLPYTKDNPINLVKPGHWYQVRNKVKANYNDESLTTAITVTDRDGNPLSLGWGSDSVSFMRNLSLAVEQYKSIDATILHPYLPTDRSQTDDEPNRKKSTAIRTRYSLRGIGTLVLEENFPCSMLDGYEYDLVVLSRDISRHTFWRGLDCIVWRRSDDLQENRLVPHRVVDILEDEISNQFPNRLATMTSISHVVVNDISLAALNEEQQAALADWLHFGGTIIINGPEAIASIETSQLKDWSPLAQIVEGEWSEDYQREFDSTWTIRVAGGERIPFQSDRRIPILTGKLAEDAEWIPTLEGLVAERLIGQGRVVMTTFPLTDAAFLRWPSYSSLIHNAILRKPYRKPSLGIDASTLYADDLEGTERNPLHSTRLRLWARDLDASLGRTDGEVEKKASENAAANFPAKKRTSLGAWNPNSLILEQATESLRESSGIAVPRISTILKLLLGYLIVLVPINWLVFRLIGRVELAWVAAPIIAMLGALYIAGSVRLDVGFSRSHNSFGFLECHNQYDRGILSSYHSLYTSLSTNYNAVYKEGSGLVAPALRAAMRTGIRDEQTLEYWNADDSGSGLQRFPVLSNSTGMLQAEEMVDLSGALRWQLDPNGSKIQLENNTSFTFRDIGVLGINNEGALVRGWMGSIEPGQSTAQSLQTGPLPSEVENRMRTEQAWIDALNAGMVRSPSSRKENKEGSERGRGQRWFPKWEDNPLLKKPTLIRVSDGRKWTNTPNDDIYMGAMLHVVAERYPLQTGEYIALGWTDVNPSRLEITPNSFQQKHKTVVLMHVRSGNLTEVRPDTRIFGNLENEEK